MTSFTIEDQTGEMTDEELERAGDLATEIVEMLDAGTDNPAQALQALAAVTSYILSEHSVSRDHANRGLQSLCMSITATITQAEQNCQVNWNQRSRH